MLKQGLELKQTQKLSPLQIQTIKLIELPTQELEQRIRKELEENPVLEENTANEEEDEDNAPREVSLSEYKDDDPIPSYKLKVNNYGKDERPVYNTFSVKESFTQSLMEQLGFRNLTEHQYAVAAFIIGSLDDDGYLRRDVDSLVDDMAFRAGIESDEKEVEEMLNQNCDLEIPERKDCLFLFRDLMCALQFYKKYGGIIYVVSIKGGSQIYYKGDMNKLDNILDMFRFSEDEDLRNDAVNKYWEAGTHTFFPCYEVLVSSACVEKVLIGDNLRETVKEEIESRGGSIERTPTYRRLLCEVYGECENAVV